MPLKLKRYQARGPNWYLRGAVRGVHIFETTGTNDKAAAEAIRIKREGGILDRSIFGAGAAVTFPEAAVSYLAAGGEAKFLGAVDEVSGEWSLLIGEYKDMLVSEIGQVQADDAANKLYPGTMPATRNRQVYGPTKAVLNHAARKWETSIRPIDNMEVKKTPVAWAPPENVRRLLPHCAPRLRLFVAMIVYTGERLEKVFEIDWDLHIDLSLRIITFTTTKNGEMRSVHVPDALLIELARVPEADRHGRMFAWSHKTHVYKPLKSACKRAGVPYLSPHKLGRHTFATWLRRYAKRDLRGLMADVGWKSINSAVRYAHVVPGESALAVDMLPDVQQNPCSSNVRPLKDRRIRKKLA